MVARARVSNHLFIDGTFHHPKIFGQLLIVLFKDIINSNYLPCFYILMSNKTEILYDLVFKSIKKIFTKYNQYKLNIITIINDTEIPLINALTYNFDNFTRIGCCLHLKQNLIRYYGLMNNKNKNIDINTTLEIIT